LLIFTVIFAFYFTLLILSFGGGNGTNKSSEVTIIMITLRVLVTARTLNKPTAASIEIDLLIG